MAGESLSDRSTAHLQLFVGVFGMGVCLPYITGVFGHVEAEVAMWALVVLAVSAGLVASAARIGPMPRTDRRSPWATSPRCDTVVAHGG